MALTRRNIKGEGWWEVDGSGIVVWRNSEGRWMVCQLEQDSGRGMIAASDYLRRHGLLNRIYPSRARAVDAVRMALSCSPLSRSILTRWRRSGGGTYLSTDGRWWLIRSKGEGRLIPNSQAVVEAFRRNPELKQRLNWQGDHTLRMCAEYADNLAQFAGLNVALEDGTH